MRRVGTRDDGQLLMLAGIVLTISFILTALTLSQVSALERAAAADEPSPLVAEWRFLHERLATNLRTAINPETDNLTFTSEILPTIAATFRSVEAEKGYDLIVRAAGGPAYAGNGNEASLTSGANYAATTYDGEVTFTHPYSTAAALEDGIIWQKPCADNSGPIAGCIGGIYLFVRLSDGETSLEESILYAVNQP
jgi:hypothetical protein